MRYEVRIKQRKLDHYIRESSFEGRNDMTYIPWKLLLRYHDEICFRFLRISKDNGELHVSPTVTTSPRTSKLRHPGAMGPDSDIPKGDPNRLKGERKVRSGPS